MSDLKIDEIIKYYVSHAKKAIQNDRERGWSSCSSEYDRLDDQIGHNEDLLESFSLIVSFISADAYFLVAMDGGKLISEKYRFDIVDKENDSVINNEVGQCRVYRL